MKRFILALTLLFVTQSAYAQIFLRQSTASQEIPLGRFVDSTDGNTEETALTIANTDIKLWKSGATASVSKNSGGATHDANGMYYCVLDATDTNTIGLLKVEIHPSGALANAVTCFVLDEAVYDSLTGTSALATNASLASILPASTDVTTPLAYSVIGTVSGGSATGTNVTTSSANTTGADYGVAWVTSISSGDPPVLTDSAGNKWEVLEVMTEGWVEGILYECKNLRTSATHTLTATSAGKLPSVVAKFFSGVRLSAAHADQNDSDHTFSGTSQITGPITPGENNCLCLVVGLHGGSGTPTANESYSGTAIAYNSTGAGNIGALMGTKIQTTAAATNPTVSQTGAGSIGAAVYSFLPHVTGTPFVTLAQSEDRRVYQREQGTEQKRVAVSGRYYGQVPTSIEIQTYKWRLSGAVGALVEDWKPVTGLLCSGGTWTAELPNVQGGWYRARARSKGVNGEVLTTGLYTNNRYGVGVIVATIGQSNAVKLFQDYGDGATGDDLTARFDAGAWGANVGDGACALANKLAAELGIPVGLMDYGVSGAGLVYNAGSGDWSSQSGGQPWPLFQTGIADVGGDFEYIVWQGCEADGENASFDATALKSAFSTLYSRILAETPRTSDTLKFIVGVPGPLAVSFTTDARWGAIRTATIEWADATPGALVGGSLLDAVLVDDYHFDGVDYAHNGKRFAQSILHDMGEATYDARGPQLFKAWRFSGSPIIYAQLYGLANAGIAEVDGTTDGGNLTGFAVSDDAFATTETISSTAIEGNLVKLTLAATPADGASVVVRFANTKTPTVTNFPYRNSLPGGDTRGIPMLPIGSTAVELREAFDASDHITSQATLAKDLPVDIGYMRKAVAGTVEAARATSNITLVSETEDEATYSTFTTQTAGDLVWDNTQEPRASAIGLSRANISVSADSDFENVSPALMWKLITNSSNELVGDKTLVLDNDTGEKTFAVDFATDLATNARINTVDTVAIDTGTAAGVTFGTSGRERNLAKIRITGVTAGTYVLNIEVTDNEGNPHAGKVTLKVVE